MARPRLEPEMFRWRPEELDERRARPSLQPALEALPPGGSVLDVGVGGGSSSLVLVPRPGLIVGVDPLPGMLDSFRDSATGLGMAVRTVLGAWPDVARQVEPADLVVCHHAIYGVAAIEAFVAALTARARKRVVLELMNRPPGAEIDPLWTRFHGLERADWPVADVAHDVLTAMGLAVERADKIMPPRRREVTPASVASARRRLFVGPEHDGEIEEFLRNHQPEGEHLVALWWLGTA